MFGRILKDLQKIELTEEEFIQLFMEKTGEPKEKAALQAKLAKIMGSSVKIGDKLVSIKI